MNPTHYSLAQIRKALVAGIPLLFMAIMLAGVAAPIGLQAAIVALVGPVFMVIGVFAAKHHSADDLQKALEALKGAGLGIVGYFTQVPTSTDNKITMGIVFLASVVGVYWARNRKA